MQDEYQFLIFAAFFGGMMLGLVCGVWLVKEDFEMGPGDL